MMLTLNLCFLHFKISYNVMFLYNYGEKTQFINTAIANPLKKKKTILPSTTHFNRIFVSLNFFSRCLFWNLFFFIRKKTQYQNLIAKPNCPLAKKFLENNFHLNMFPVLKRWENAN